jgi:maltose O-acetyltransferase
MTAPLSRSPVDLASSFLEKESTPPPSIRPPGKAFESLLDETSTVFTGLDVPRAIWNATRILPSFALPRARARLLAAIGCDIRKGVGVLGHVNLIGPRGSLGKLRIGSGSVIGPNASFCLDAPIHIGKNVSIGPSATLYTATHSLGSGSRRMQLGVMARPIVVEDGAWIGFGAIILSGVRVGRGSVVAAGSVVNRDVPENVLVAGNPAVISEELPNR